MSVLFCFLFLKISSISSASCSIKYEWIGNCYTTIEVCRGVRHLQLKYWATASTNGITGPATPHFESNNGATEHSIFSLFQKLPTSTNTYGVVKGCNCVEYNKTIDKYDIPIKECFNFNTEPDAGTLNMNYFSWATSPNNQYIQGFFCCSTNKEQTVENSIKDLKKKDNFTESNHESKHESKKSFPVWKAVLIGTVVVFGILLVYCAVEKIKSRHGYQQIHGQ